MRDEEIVRRFDGRGRVELQIGRYDDASQMRRIEQIGHQLGYRLLSTVDRGRFGWHLVYQRDDAPLARRRAERTIQRLRAGGPMTPQFVEAPPPPPPPPPPAGPPPPPRPRFQVPDGPPPPPPAVGGTGPRVPPRPPFPPPPGEPPPAPPGP
ncbi:hypothetical protein [Streptomyces sp. NPDC003247]|uniref:hypothetical protein n=1 Tax=Streptomyces sp. NPDC003247 TaxID=3364677 RepID=UPI0036928A5C